MYEYIIYIFDYECNFLCFNVDVKYIKYFNFTILKL